MVIWHRGWILRKCKSADFPISSAPRKQFDRFSSCHISTSVIATQMILGTVQVLTFNYRNPTLEVCSSLCFCDTYLNSTAVFRKLHNLAPYLPSGKAERLHLLVIAAATHQRFIWIARSVLEIHVFKVHAFENSQSGPFSYIRSRIVVHAMRIVAHSIPYRVAMLSHCSTTGVVRAARLQRLRMNERVRYRTQSFVFSLTHARPTHPVFP